MSGRSGSGVIVASFDDHCFVDEKHLGQRFPEVHRWLDEFFRKFGNAHRRERHHLEGIEEVRAMWGHEAARSAELHIVIDMGHVPSKADWEAGGITGADGEFVPMDAMGIPDTHVSSLVSGLILASATPYKTRLPCSGCNDETEQFLTNIRAGEFKCVKCRGKNFDPEYRIS